MNDHQKLKALLKDLGLNYHDIARITGLKYDSIKNQLQPKKKIPSWMKLVLYVHDRNHLEYIPYSSKSKADG